MSRRVILLVALGGAGVLGVFIGCLIVIPHLLYPALGTGQLARVRSVSARIQLQQAQSQLANDARTAVLQAMAGPLVIVGAGATWWQVHISREGQLTDRFTTAVDQLAATAPMCVSTVSTRSSALTGILARTATQSATCRAPSSGPRSLRSLLAVVDDGSTRDVEQSTAATVRADCWADDASRLANALAQAAI